MSSQESLLKEDSIVFDNANFLEICLTAQKEKWATFALTPLRSTKDFAFGCPPDRKFFYNYNNIDLSPIKNLTSVKYLTLHDCVSSRTDSSAIASLKDIKHLDIQGHRLDSADIDAIFQATNLASIVLKSSSAQLDPEALRAAHTITYLDISSCHIDDEWMDQLAISARNTMRKLRAFVANNNKASSYGLKFLQERARTLRIVELESNRVGPHGVLTLLILDQLQTLNLNDNAIGADGAQQLQHLSPTLRTLRISYNKCGGLPFKAPHSLHTLESSYNDTSDDWLLAQAPAALGDLRHLELNRGTVSGPGLLHLAQHAKTLHHLSLASNNLGPQDVGSLRLFQQLTHLDVSGNPVSDAGMSRLELPPNVKHLNCSKTGLTDVGAKALSSQTNQLETLLLGRNKIADYGATELARQQKSLTRIDLSKNIIGDDGARKVLDILAEGPIQWVGLSGNPIAFLPPEVLTDGYGVIASYSRYKYSSEEPLNEAKLMIVGNEAVGKTSLVRMLTTASPCNPNERKTVGIAAHEKIEVSDWAPLEADIKVNIWDFGGQEIMHGTHKYFLTERSIYLIVLEDRRENDNSLDEWLPVVGAHGGGPPTIVVINKSDQGSCRLLINETRLVQEWPFIIGFMRTSCIGDSHSAESISELRSLIIRTLLNDARLKHVRSPIPVAWRKVKDSVEKRAPLDKVLDFHDFQSICLMQDEPLEDINELRALLRLLHDLGVVIAHGIDSGGYAAIRGVTLLDPNWLTGAIYQILNRSDIVHNRGVFAREDLPKYLDSKIYPEHWYDFILEMMESEVVGLCFALPGTRRTQFLVPEALPASEPPADRWPTRGLRFRYQYDFIPRRVIPRLIVRSHDKAGADAVRWRTGLVLNIDECEIWISADRKKGVVDIRVTGPQKQQRSALRAVCRDIEWVNAMEGELAPVAKVPLPDCHGADVPYSYLLSLEESESGSYEFAPPGGAIDKHGRLVKYKVEHLLDGVRGVSGDMRPKPKETRSGATPGAWLTLNRVNIALGIIAATTSIASIVLTYLLAHRSPEGPAANGELAESSEADTSGDGSSESETQ